MFRASSCPSSGEWYKTDNVYGVQHWPCCSRLVEKRWFGVHLLGLVSPIPTSAHLWAFVACSRVNFTFTFTFKCKP
jgi:hypothetical protein